VTQSSQSMDSTPVVLPSVRGILATRHGRLLAFFFLYVTEGIPLGFNAVALATIMRKQGLGPAAIGMFVATLYLPWSWKWLMGPVVDLVYSSRLGRRRAWIVGCQTLMALTLLSAIGVDFKTQFFLFTAIILIHNMFAATMDVAIDALAVTTLPPNERGTANGLMFAGAYLGNALGGAGVLFLLPYVSTSVAFLLVVGAILLVVALVSFRLVEPKMPAQPRERNLGREIYNYLRTLIVACLGSRNGIAGLFFAVLPAGAYGLGLALQSNLAVELRLNETQIGWLSLWSTVVAASGCILGGLLSDRFGRQLTLGIYALLTALPTLWLAYQLHTYGWIMPVADVGESVASVPTGLVRSLWIAAIVYSFVQGLMYGTRTAMFMDLCRSEIAATQFTAYMSLMNLALAYSAWWQGRSAETWGYPLTLTLDAALGCLCLVPLAFISTSTEV
jgi:PAT family beta-lactamase induction signal transducer AmpG